MKAGPDTTLQELADVLREDRAKPDPWDETSVKTSLTRLRGRAPVGERLYGTAPFGKWRTQTRDQVRGRLFIAGLTSDELIAPWVIEGAMLAPGDVVSGQSVKIGRPAVRDRVSQDGKHPGVAVSLKKKDTTQ